METRSRLEQVGDFTVRVPPRELAEAVSHCGTVPERDHNKLVGDAAHASPQPAGAAPIIKECLLHYECRTLRGNDVNPAALAQAVLDDAYAKCGFYRICFGEIVASHAKEDAQQSISSDCEAGQGSASCCRR